MTGQKLRLVQKTAPGLYTCANTLRIYCVFHCVNRCQRERFIGYYSYSLKTYTCILYNDTLMAMPQNRLFCTERPKMTTDFYYKHGLAV